MDGLLDPKDSQEIGKKIEESRYATELFHKIRDVMRRLRLAAPSITERGSNLDCNTVAEYLDNALPADRVPDFEEISLKSDVHLAEVASCHQILTMVLGEPAEIDPESRQRMYQLPTVANRVDEERLAAAEAATVLSGDGNGPIPPAVSAAKTRPRPVVPEYLRDPPRKSWLVPAAAMVFFAGAAAILILALLGQFNRDKPLGKALYWAQVGIYGKQADDEKDGGDGKRSVNPSGDSFVGSSGTVETSGKAGPKPSNSAPVVPGSGKDAANSTVAIQKTGSPAAAREKPAPGKLPGAGSEDAGPDILGPENAGPENVGPENVGLVKAPAAPGDATPMPGVPTLSPSGTTTPAGAATTQRTGAKPNVGESPRVPSVAGPSLQGPGSKPPPDGSTAETRPAKSPVELAKIDSTHTAGRDGDRSAIGPVTPSSPPVNNAKIGRFISDGQDVLLKFDANNSGWRRVLPEEFLAGRQPLLALPSYRSRVVILNVGATLELINGSRIELLPDNAQDLPGVDIDFGRVVIRPLAQAGARLRVLVGSHAGTITLTSVESIVGLDVTRVHEPGKDPERAPFPRALTKLYVAKGGALWEEGAGKQPVRLTAPAELRLDGEKSDTPPSAGKDMPKWITANTVSEDDQRAALSVSQALPAERPASLGLMELTLDRRKEVRWLAVRCLGYLGQFDPMTAALNDVGFRREWPDYVDQLKEAIARGPETAASIRQSLERQYGTESTAALYRMLCGYTDKDLAGGEDDRLVKFLDHESPVFRVLAFENLREITHNKTFYYHPEATTAAKRQQYVQLWRRQQQSGRIRYNVQEVKPRTAPGEIVPEAPKPLVPSKPTGVQQPAGTEPIDSDNSPAPQPPTGQPSSQQLPLTVPEPDPAERRSPVAFPEP